MKTQTNITLLLIPVLAIGLIFGAATAQAQQERPRMNIIAPLKMALKAAGAPELSAEQESEIRTLITDFRNAHPRPVPNADIPDARKAYEEAILNGDSAGAASQAELIAKERLDHMVQLQADEAVFAVNVMGVLNSDPAQAEALTTQMGTRGFVRLVLSLVNNPGGPGLMGRQGGIRQRAGRRLAPGFAAP